HFFQDIFKACGCGAVMIFNIHCTHQLFFILFVVIKINKIHAGLPALRRAGGGAAVLVGSVLGEATDEDFLTAAYATSKAGLVALSRAAAREGAADDIRVNVVAAGLVATPMAARAAHDPHVQSRLADLQPLGAAMLDPDDVAAAVAWLLSPDAARVTGTTLPVDAGWLL
ncbi:MAG: SDR family oxidoreductase, partial [Egibacteraceae bacterium]